MATVQAPAADHRIHELRSIASSIGPAFPDAAKTLRAIADSLYMGEGAS